MKKAFIIAFLSACVSLYMPLTFAEDTYCPRPEELSKPTTPPRGWIFSLDPVLSGGIYNYNYKDKYYFSGLIYSLDKKYFERIFCRYQSTKASGGLYSVFVLISPSTYDHVLPNTELPPWQPYSQLANSFICLPGKNNISACTFNNNPG